MSKTPTDAAKLGDTNFTDSRILVVDDNVQNLELLVDNLDSLGCKVSTAKDGLLSSGDRATRSCWIFLPRYPTSGIGIAAAMIPANSASIQCWHRSRALMP